MLRYFILLVSVLSFCVAHGQSFSKISPMDSVLGVENTKKVYKQLLKQVWYPATSVNKAITGTELVLVNYYPKEYTPEIRLLTSLGPQLDSITLNAIRGQMDILEGFVADKEVAVVIPVNFVLRGLPYHSEELPFAIKQNELIVAAQPSEMSLKHFASDSLLLEQLYQSEVSEEKQYEILNELVRRNPLNTKLIQKRMSSARKSNETASIQRDLILLKLLGQIELQFPN